MTKLYLFQRSLQHLFCVCGVENKDCSCGPSLIKIKHGDWYYVCPCGKFLNRASTCYVCGAEAKTKQFWFGLTFPQFGTRDPEFPLAYWYCQCEFSGHSFDNAVCNQCKQRQPQFSHFWCFKCGILQAKKKDPVCNSCNCQDFLIPFIEHQLMLTDEKEPIKQNQYEIYTQVFLPQLTLETEWECPDCENWFIENRSKDACSCGCLPSKFVKWYKIDQSQLKRNSIEDTHCEICGNLPKLQFLHYGFCPDAKNNGSMTHFLCPTCHLITVVGNRKMNETFCSCSTSLMVPLHYRYLETAPFAGLKNKKKKKRKIEPQSTCPKDSDLELAIAASLLDSTTINDDEKRGPSGKNFLFTWESERETLPWWCTTCIYLNDGTQLKCTLCDIHRTCWWECSNCLYKNKLTEAPSVIKQPVTCVICCLKCNEVKLFFQDGISTTEIEQDRMRKSIGKFSFLK